MHKSVNSIILINQLSFHSKQTAQNLMILAGSTFNNRGGVKIGVAKIIMHENYDDETQDNDIALIQLSTPLRFSSSIQPIALPNDNQIVPDNSYCLVSGWGDRGKLIKGSTILQAVQVPIVNFDKCNKTYEADDGLTPRMMCAGFDQGGKDACQYVNQSNNPMCINRYFVLKMFNFFYFSYSFPLEPFF